MECVGGDVSCVTWDGRLGGRRARRGPRRLDVIGGAERLVVVVRRELLYVRVGRLQVQVVQVGDERGQLGRAVGDCSKPGKYNLNRLSDS